MLAPPDGLAAGALVSLLAARWGITAASISYRAVGAGSHHWEVTDAAGARWFVTADELENKRRSQAEPLPAALARLRRSLAAARSLRDHGRDFAVAPVPALDGGLVAPAGERFAVALYPFLEAQSFEWGEFATPEHRRGVLDRIIAVHTAPAAARGPADTDDFTVPHRDELEAALDPAAAAADCGPYARPAAALLARNAGPVRRLLGRYDRLGGQGRSHASRMVLTHGEPHPGNTMLGPGGWLLIDWDTALVAPPERDLWHLDPGDGSVLAAYAEATGVTAQPALLELYRLRWDIADIAVSVSGLRRPHQGSPDDEMSWQVLCSIVPGGSD